MSLHALFTASYHLICLICRRVISFIAFVQLFFLGFPFKCLSFKCFSKRFTEFNSREEKNVKRKSFETQTTHWDQRLNRLNHSRRYHHNHLNDNTIENVYLNGLSFFFVAFTHITCRVYKWLNMSGVLFMDLFHPLIYRLMRL